MSIKLSPLDKPKPMYVLRYKTNKYPKPFKEGACQQQRYCMWCFRQWSHPKHDPDCDSLTNMFTVEHWLFIKIISWRLA